MSTHTTTPPTANIAVATFAPASEAIVCADHIAMAIVSENVFKALCASSLDVPAALWLGHTGTGHFGAGTRYDGVMEFEVTDREAALAVIQESLAEAGIAAAHYELALRRGVEGHYQTIWRPPGRTSVLHGLSHAALITEVQKRLDQMNGLIEVECAPLLALLKSQERLRRNEEVSRESLLKFAAAIELLLQQLLPFASDQTIAEALNQHLDPLYATLRATAANSVTDLPACSPSFFLREMRQTSQDFVDAPHETIAAKVAALRSHQQALERILSVPPEHSLSKDEPLLPPE